jgi:hypothetical protein
MLDKLPLEMSNATIMAQTANGLTFRNRASYI